MAAPSNSAFGDAGGASAAFRVTRTVSFIKGTLDVFFDSGIFELCLVIGIREDAVDGASSRLSFSLMRVMVGLTSQSKRVYVWAVKLPALLLVEKVRRLRLRRRAAVESLKVPPPLKLWRTS